MDQVEKYIMTRLYKSVFCPESTDDERKDLATQKRIRWVPPAHHIHEHMFISTCGLIHKENSSCLKRESRVVDNLERPRQGF